MRDNYFFLIDTSEIYGGCLYLYFLDNHNIVCYDTYTKDGKISMQDIVSMDNPKDLKEYFKNNSSVKCVDGNREINKYMMVKELMK